MAFATKVSDFATKFSGILAEIRGFFYKCRLLLQILIAISTYGAVYSGVMIFLLEYPEHPDTDLILTIAGFLTVLVIVSLCVYIAGFRVLDKVGLTRAATNFDCVVKGFSSMFTIVVSILLDTTLKNFDKGWAICFCSMMFVEIVVLMAVFGINHDFDCASAFLAASVMLFYELSRPMWQTIPLTVVAAFLLAFKVLIVEGQSPNGAPRR